MIISIYFIEFFLFSIIGWIFECIYCTCKEHHWQNRGFLFGPVCPIYGSGAVMASIVFHHIGIIARLPVWQLFLVCALCSAVLEYGTSFALEKLFHAMWWDYRDMPLNLNGRICLPATILFGIAGVFIIRRLLPAAALYEKSIPPLAAEAAALVMMALISADTAITTVSLTSLLEKLEQLENDFNTAAESAYQRVETAPQALQAQIQEKNAAMRLQLQERAQNLSYRQKYILSNIRRFPSESRAAAAARMKKALETLSRRKPES